MYKLPNIPKYNFKNFRIKKFKILGSRFFLGIICIIVAGVIVGFLGSMTIKYYFPSQIQSLLQYLKPTTDIVKDNSQPEKNLYLSKIPYEQAIIDAAKNVSPSVVSIVISKNLPVYEQEFINPLGELSPFDIQIPQYVQKGTKYQEVGAGSGFIITEEGLILTNKHVVSDSKADYTVITNDGEKYSSKVLALDPVQDLAIIKIELDEDQVGKKFLPVILGNSSGIQIGQTAIAIGNSLGEFSNTVSVGVISGLGRTISASDKNGSVSERLENIIQTDAAINSGNSGGPLLNLRGEVIGINTAMANGAEAIGFAIPIDMAKKDIDQVIKTNKITYPFLGVRYILIDEEVQKEFDLDIDYGAFISKGDSSEPAVTPGSAADKAGIKVNDIILTVNGEKITVKNSMAMIIRKYNVTDEVILHILRKGEEQDIKVVLGERPS